jgi:hypothetical protein
LPTGGEVPGNKEKPGCRAQRNTPENHLAEQKMWEASSGHLGSWEKNGLGACIANLILSSTTTPEQKISFQGDASRNQSLEAVTAPGG